MINETFVRYTELVKLNWPAPTVAADAAPCNKNAVARAPKTLLAFLRFIE
jgi:hypothetical protein